MSGQGRCRPAGHAGDRGAHLATLAATHAGSTPRRHLAAIGRAHRMAGQPWQRSHPAIHDTLAGIARRHGTPGRRAAAIGTAEIRRLVATCTDGLTGTRDRALMLLGFAAALRRSELVAVQREHLTVTPEGLRLLIQRAKADREGRGGRVRHPARQESGDLPGPRDGSLAAGQRLPLRPGVPQDRPFGRSRDQRPSPLRPAADPGAAQARPMLVG